MSNRRIRETLNLYNLSLQIRCDISDVIVGLRPTARLMLRSGSETEICVRTIIEAGLFVAVGRGVKWQTRRKELGLVDWMGDGPESNDGMEKFVVLYIGRDRQSAEASRAADETGDDTVFGRALGYPACCIKFVHERGAVPELREVFTLYTKEGRYDPWCWPGAMALDRSLLIHYPCSTSCDHSRTLGRSRWEYILHSGCRPLIAQLRAAHELIYWLDNDGQVQAGSRAPADAQAATWPDGSLD